MQCSYFDAHRCSSCTLMGTPYPQQVADKDAVTRDLLAGADGAAARWEAPYVGAESGFRNKAKMVVGGTSKKPTLGILDAEGAGVDLRRCGVVDPAITEALPVIATFIRVNRIQPYHVPTRRGELKHVLVTANPEGRLMLRFVVRSEAGVRLVRNGLDGLLERLPQVAIVSANLLPGHVAALEGPDEVHLYGPPDPAHAGQRRHPPAAPPGLLPDQHRRRRGAVRAGAGVDRLGGTLPRCGTSTAGWAASRSTRRRRAGPSRASRSRPGRGGGRHVAARRTRPSGRRRARSFRTSTSPSETPPHGPNPRQPRAAELVLVNPPRRGIGPRAGRRGSRPATRSHVIYSSCNAETLGQGPDRPCRPGPCRSVRVMDMFPQTEALRGHHAALEALIGCPSAESCP
jgi:23S rRNA (uracil747-C5)-methyltransferase